MSNNSGNDTGRIGSPEYKQEAPSLAESHTRSPWNPSVFYALALLCGFGAAGILAGINYRRLGKPKLRWPTIGISVIAFVAYVVGFVLAGIEENEWLFYLVNIPPAVLLERLQRSHYESWKEHFTSPRGSGWGIPVTVGLSGIALGFTALFVVALTVTPWTVYETGDISPIVISQELVDTIENNTDADAFSFQAVQGECYVIQTGAASTTTPLEDTMLTLWYGDGTTILLYNNDYGGSLSARIEWTAQATGTYYVTVETGDMVSTGDYTLLIQCVSR